MFFITSCLMLPRRCLDKFKGSQKWSRQKYTIHYLTTTQKKWNAIFLLLYPAVNSRVALKSMFFYHMMSNTAAQVSRLIKGAPEVIAAITHNSPCKNHTKNWNLLFVCFTSPSIPRLHWNPCFFITWCLMLPRRCLDSLKGPQKWSRQ